MFKRLGLILSIAFLLQYNAFGQYTNISAGLWSSASSWSGGIIPPAGGGTNISIVFNPSSAYTSTNDLIDGFYLNQLSLIGNRNITITNTSTESFIFASNGATNPVITNATASTLTIALPMYLTNDTTVLGNTTIRRNVSGIASMIKSDGGTLSLTSSNSFQGFTLNSGGTLSLGHNYAIGTNTLTINGGTILDAIVLTLPNNPIVMNGSWTKQDSARTINMGDGPVTINSNVFITTTHAVRLGGTVSGPISAPTSTNALDIGLINSGNDPGLILGAPVTLRSNQSIGASGCWWGFTNAISDGGNNYGINVTNGTVYFAGSNTFTGILTVYTNATARVGYYDAGNTKGYIKPSAVVVNLGGKLDLGELNLGSLSTIDPTATITNNGTFRVGGPITGTHSQGTNFGLIVGSGSLQISASGGHGGILLNNPNNSFAGPITFFGDANPILTFNSIKNVGGGNSSIGAPTTVEEGALNFDSYTVVYNGSGDSSDRRWILSGNGTINADGTTTVGSPLEFTSSLTPTGAARTITLTGTGYGKWSADMTNSQYGLTITRGAGTGVWEIASANVSATNIIASNNSGANCGTLKFTGNGTVTVIGTYLASGLGGSAGGGIGYLDFSGSSVLTARVQRIYSGVTEHVGNSQRGTFILAATNYLNASQMFSIGGEGPSGSTAGGMIGLMISPDNSVTYISSPTCAVSQCTGNGTTSGSGWFTNGVNSLTYIAGTNDTRTSMRVAYGSFFNSSPVVVGICDFSYGYISLQLTNLFVGYRGPNNSAGGTTYGGLLMNGSSNHIDILGDNVPVRIGNHGDTKVITVNGIVYWNNLDTTSVINATDNGTAIMLANKTSSTGTCNGVLHIIGGQLKFTTTGSAIAGGNNATGSTLDLNGCTLVANSSSPNFINGINTAVISNTVTFNTDVNDVGIPQSFSGTGSIVKNGNGSLTMSGTNTVSNSFHVQQGIVTFTHTQVMNNASIYLYTGATNNLPFNGKHAVTDVYVDGVLQPKGEYGAINLPQLITGPGKLRSGNFDFGNKKVIAPGVDDSSKVYNSILIQ